MMKPLESPPLDRILDAPVSQLFEQHKDIASPLINRHIQEMKKKRVSPEAVKLLGDANHAYLQEIEQDLHLRYHLIDLTKLSDLEAYIDTIFSEVTKHTSSFGTYLKEEAAIKILQTCPPQDIMNFFQVKCVDDIFHRLSPLKIISLSRYTERQSWQKTYISLLESLPKEAFEQRQITHFCFTHDTYKALLRNSNQPQKLWNMSHNKVTGQILIYHSKDISRFNTPYLLYALLFMHYIYETSCAGAFYTYMQDKTNYLGQVMVQSFTNSKGRIEGLGANVYSETIFWAKGVNLFFLLNPSKHSEMIISYAACGYAKKESSKYISMHIIDHLWNLNGVPGAPHRYHFQEQLWTNTSKQLCESLQHTSTFEERILKNLHMTDMQIVPIIFPHQ